jgi:adenosylcobinamide-GDP ribazoletransferase
MSVGSMRSALAFLTVLPVAGDGAPGERLGRAFFPAVGVLLGVLAAAAYWGASVLAGPLLGAVAALAALAALTGGMHLDGLADCADGLLVQGTRERRLDVMRDPRLGSFGVVVLVLVLLAGAAALMRLDPRTALVALVTAGAFSRLAMLGLLVALPYVRSQGLGTAAAGGGRRDLLLGAVLAAPVLVLDWRRGLVAAAVAAVVTAGLAAFARARIGGATGDVYGAGSELAQLSVLVVFAVQR